VQRQRHALAVGDVGNGFDAAVSATALHWLSADHLAALYGRVADVLLPGRILASCWIHR
jgi:hypothetical protein